MITKLTNKEFDKMFKDNYSKLSIYAQRFVVDYSTAEDMVSDAFYKLYQRRKNLHLDYPVKNYLYKIVYNNCIDHIKLKQQTYISDKIEVCADSFNTFSYSVDQIIFEDDYDENNRNALSSRLMDAINMLPDKCKQVIKMRKIEGLSHKVISEKLNISPKTVETQIYRGIKKLKEVLLLLFLIIISFI